MSRKSRKAWSGALVTGLAAVVTVPIVVFSGAAYADTVEGTVTGSFTLSCSQAGTVLLIASAVNVTESSESVTVEVTAFGKGPESKPAPPNQQVTFPGVDSGLAGVDTGPVLYQVGSSSVQAFYPARVCPFTPWSSRLPIELNYSITTVPPTTASSAEPTDSAGATTGSGNSSGSTGATASEGGSTSSSVGDTATSVSPTSGSASPTPATASSTVTSLATTSSTPPTEQCTEIPNQHLLTSGPYQGHCVDNEPGDWPPADGTDSVGSTEAGSAVSAGADSAPPTGGLVGSGDTAGSSLSGDSGALYAPSSSKMAPLGGWIDLVAPPCDCGDVPR